METSSSCRDHVNPLTKHDGVMLYGKLPSEPLGLAIFSWAAWAARNARATGATGARECRRRELMGHLGLRRGHSEDAAGRIRAARSMIGHAVDAIGIVASSQEGSVVGHGTAMGGASSDLAM